MNGGVILCCGISEPVWRRDDDRLDRLACVESLLKITCRVYGLGFRV